jgi:hypothetical protein
MKVHFQTFQAPRWAGPVVLLLILALIPFALMLAALLAAVAVGYSVVRFLSPSGRTPLENRSPGSRGLDSAAPGGTVIDADYEIKDENGEN